MSTELLNDKGENLQQLQQHKPTTVALVTTQRAIKKKTSVNRYINPQLFIGGCRYQFFTQIWRYKKKAVPLRPIFVDFLFLWKLCIKHLIINT